MAISNLEYILIKQLRDQKVLNLGKSILELGESNWYGDVDLAIFKKDIEIYSNQEDRSLIKSKFSEILDKLMELNKNKDIDFRTRKSLQTEIIYSLGKLWYRVFFHTTPALIIDFNGPTAKKLDLNKPHKLDQQFDYVINFGTGEHVFNLYQFYKSVHEWTKPKGHMIHSVPFSGWFDHGFYNANPTLFWDLAKANQYIINFMLNGILKPAKLNQLNSRKQAIEYFKQNKIPENSLTYLMFEKSNKESDFVVPIQGIYDKQINNKDLYIYNEWIGMR